jgi:nucleotide-binding universal stress UspA family protein
MDAARAADPPVAQPIVLGTDFGQVSVAAEAAAIALAAREHRPLVIVNAIDPGRLRLPGGRFLQRVDQVRAQRQASAMSLVERARARSVDARTLVWEGDPATCIVDAARAELATRIVIGSHGRGRVARAIAGSVSASVRESAPCPVDVVVASAEAPGTIDEAPNARPSAPGAATGRPGGQPVG